MHEMSIVQALLEQVDEEVAASGYSGPVTALELVIGRMAGVHVESLRFAFDFLSPGTLADGATLRIEQPCAQLQCLDCRRVEEIDELVLACPGCGSRRVRIEGGQQMLLKSIELADSQSAETTLT